MKSRWVADANGCWLWAGGMDARDAYGKYEGRQAHRVVYERLVGPIPDGLELDHLCRVPRCVNPVHLDPVTTAENMRRRYEVYVECVNGHAYTPENTYTRPSGHRDCRTCIRERVRAYTARKKRPA